jgi:hypothetical protein
MYRLGRGVPKDIKKAIFWFSQSAKNGNEAAAERLAVLGAPAVPAPAQTPRPPWPRPPRCPATRRASKLQHRAAAGWPPAAGSQASGTNMVCGAQSSGTRHLRDGDPTRPTPASRHSSTAPKYRNPCPTVRTAMAAASPANSSSNTAISLGPPGPDASQRRAGRPAMSGSAPCAATMTRGSTGCRKCGAFRSAAALGHGAAPRRSRGGAGSGSRSGGALCRRRCGGQVCRAIRTRAPRTTAPSSQTGNARARPGGRPPRPLSAAEMRAADAAAGGTPASTRGSAGEAIAEALRRWPGRPALVLAARQQRRRRLRGRPPSEPGRRARAPGPAG